MFIKPSESKPFWTPLNQCQTRSVEVLNIIGSQWVPRDLKHSRLPECGFVVIFTVTQTSQALLLVSGKQFLCVLTWCPALRFLHAEQLCNPVLCTPFKHGTVCYTCSKNMDLVYQAGQTKNHRTSSHVAQKYSLTTSGLG